MWNHAPKEDLEIKEPSQKEVTIIRARYGSTTGSNGLRYKVYKKCPKILRKLWSLFREM
jgi:hypothetical protein